MTEPRPRPPVDDAELLVRAQRIAGRSVVQVAERFGLPVPPNLRANKGWLGQLVEYALGASAASRAEPDFPHLGIELKTVPVDSMARPRESTYVCVAPLDGGLASTWEESWCRRKLDRVLFLPVVGDGPLATRVLGAALLWAPSEEERGRLQADWEEITERVVRGDLEGLDARVGEILQLRPKGATARDTTWTLDADAQWVQTMPRGFYLRRAFTAGLLQRAFGVASMS
ncbi:MAG: DNA mismatch repair endonuclease MutH [Deltaproteobacteria bacterium]|nr:DNA mismatch repair endonuclease MutH [Deltaproteobacteria bacterium]